MNVTQNDLTTLDLTPIEALLRRAGRLATDHDDWIDDTRQKGTADYVTAVDTAVQALIVDELRRLTPNALIVGEEEEKETQAKRLAAVPEAPLAWILDPIDGTTNLMRRLGHSAISLGLTRYGRLAAGWVFNPWRDELSFARAGGGAFRNGRPIHVQPRAGLDQCLIGFGTTPYDRSPDAPTFRLVASIYPDCLEIRRFGAASLDLAMIADGRQDAFFEWSLQPWDVAAGILLVEEAGGIVTRFDGSPVTFDRAGSILAATPAIHAELLRRFKAIL